MSSLPNTPCVFSQLADQPHRRIARTYYRLEPSDSLKVAPPKMDYEADKIRTGRWLPLPLIYGAQSWYLWNILRPRGLLLSGSFKGCVLMTPYPLTSFVFPGHLFESSRSNKRNPQARYLRLVSRS
jgi:hypothetical protein